MLPMTPKAPIVNEEKSKPGEESASSSGGDTKIDNMTFWNLLKVAKDKITTVECKGILKAGDRSLSTHGASIYVSAKKTSATCWELTKQDSPDWTKVYLLNYSPKRVTCVPREAYENDHDFFITVELSGCRFTITDHSVLHIAADVGAAYEAGDVRRDKAE